MHQRHLFTDIGQIQRFLNRRIATPNHGNLTPLVEKPIAGGTGRHAAPIERLLRLKPKPARLCAGRQNDCIRRHLAPGIKAQDEGP